MTLKIIGIVDRHNSKLQKNYFMVFLRDEKDHNWNLYLDPTNRNYPRWQPLLTKGQWLKNAKPLDGNKKLIDADSPVESTQDPAHPELDLL